MQTKRLSVLLAAGALAGVFFVTQAPEAQACGVLDNSLSLKYNTNGDSYCIRTNEDLQIKKIPKAVAHRGIIRATLATKGEPGSCSFYLFTREGHRHFRFNIGPFDSETTTARRDTYFGFRLGC